MYQNIYRYKLCRLPILNYVHAVFPKLTVRPPDKETLPEIIVFWLHCDLLLLLVLSLLVVHRNDFVESGSLIKHVQVVLLLSFVIVLVLLGLLLDLFLDGI